MPVLIDASMPAAHRQTLEVLFPEQEQIVEIEAFRSVLVQRLWVAPRLSYYPLYDSGTGRFEWDAISVAPHRIAPIMKELRRRAALLACRLLQLRLRLAGCFWRASRSGTAGS